MVKEKRYYVKGYAGEHSECGATIVDRQSE